MIAPDWRVDYDPEGGDHTISVGDCQREMTCTVDCCQKRLAENTASVPLSRTSSRMLSQSGPMAGASLAENREPCKKQIGWLDPS